MTPIRKPGTPMPAPPARDAAARAWGALVWGLVLVSLWMAAGCAGRGRALHPPVVPAADSTAVQTAPADTSRTTPVPVDTLGRPVPESHPPEGETPRRPVRRPVRKPPAEPDEPRAGAGADTSCPGLPSISAPYDSVADSTGISIDLPGRIRSELEEKAKADLAAADALTTQYETRQLQSRDREKLETALGLIAQARAALAGGQTQSAANLAYKARLLAQEISEK